MYGIQIIRDYKIFFNHLYNNYNCVRYNCVFIVTECFITEIISTEFDITSFNFISQAFSSSITLIEISLINIPAPSLCTWIHFQHHGHMTRTPKQNSILLLDPLYGHMTKAPEQNNIHVQINNDVWAIVSLVINLI